jgi:PST family polysaccharide transporter
MPPQRSGQGALRRLAVRGAGATLVAGGVTLGIQIAATVLLARILAPADFGLVAMVTTFSLLLVNFGYNGLTEAIVQREDMDHALASSLFWINAAVGIVLTVVFAASGSVLAALFHNPLVAPIAAGISLTICATSLSTVHLALLKRAMLFSELSVNDICGRFVSVALSIVLGFKGWGYWALVVGTVAQPVSIGIGALLLCRWTPGYPRRVPGIGPVLKFALNTYGYFGTNYASRNTDNLLVGWRFDAKSLGFYKKAYDLFNLTVSQFVASLAIVVVAGLSRVLNDEDRYRRYLLDALSVMAFVGMAIGACLTLVGNDLIYVLLGPKWGPAGRIFTFFGPGVGISILYTTNGWIHLSVGRPDRWFRWALVEFVVTCSSFLIGLHWGPDGIAMAWSASLWFLSMPAIWYAGKPVSLKITSVLAVTWKYVAASAITVCAIFLLNNRVHLLQHMPGLGGAVSRIVAILFFAFPLYLGLVAILHGGFDPLLKFVSLFRDMVRSKSSSQDNSNAEFDATSPARQGLFTSAEPSPSAPGVMESAGAAASIQRNELPLVSILVPAYNAEEWIADTIHSALAQTWPNKEIIVVDDGSQDATLTIARQFECHGVRVISQKNQGASAARNNAFSHSRGAYIQWLDADDLLAPDKISKQMELVLHGLSKKILLSSPWGRFMYRTSKAEFMPTTLWCDLAPKEWLLRKMSQNIYMQTATWLVSREVTEAAGPWDIRLLGDDDGEYFCRVLLASDGVRFVGAAKVYYRAFRFDSLSYVGRFPKKIDAHWTSMQLHIKYLRSFEDTAPVRSACVQYIRDSLIYFYPESSQILVQAQDLALELGEPLGAPDLSWKYSWIERSFGWVAAKEAQHRIRRARWRLAKFLDYFLFQIESRTQRILDVAAGKLGGRRRNTRALALKEF